MKIPGWMLACMASLAFVACSRIPVETAVAAAPAEPFQPVTSVYECGGKEGGFILVTRTRPGGVHVFLPPQQGEPYRVLSEVIPGERYAGEDVELVVGERSAELCLDKVCSRCTYDRRASIWEHAKLNGVDFRALGNEPGWVLEIRFRDRLDLSYDYGTQSLSLPIVATRSDSTSRQTWLTGRDGEVEMQVTLEGAACHDTMSDEVFPTRVRIEVADRVFSGCGRALH